MFKITARTVLELGAELISSDIIAFYELIKNGFDAGTTRGVDIRFDIAISRHSYLKLQDSIATEESRDNSDVLSRHKTAIEDAIIPGVSDESRRELLAMINGANSLDELAIDLRRAQQRLNTISVTDRGSGMSMDDLDRNFLVIGTPSRKREVEAALAAGAQETPYLGEKGIGRLSAMRLGERLCVETARRDDTSMNILRIDWSDFTNIDAMLDQVPVAPQVGADKPSKDWSGTSIVISDLLENWTASRVHEMCERAFGRLTDPFDDPADRPRVAVYWNGDRVTVPVMPASLTEAAHARVSGRYEIVDGRPLLTTTVDVINLGFEHPIVTDTTSLDIEDLQSALIGKDGDIEDDALTSVGPFSFDAYWFNRRRLSRVDATGDGRAIRELQEQWSGILLFRDKFRVFPYGEDDDDWLELDRRALRRSGYTLNKTQFSGRVNISRTGNPRLVDQTNREGLRVTSEQRVLLEVLRYAIQDQLGVVMRDVEREYKEQRIDLSDAKTRVASLETTAKSAVRQLRRMTPPEGSEALDQVQQTLAELSDFAARARQRIAEVEKESRQMVEMAGVGLMVEVVAHELARASENSLKALGRLKDRDLPIDVRSHLSILRAEMKSISKRVRILDPMSVSGRQRQESFALDVLLRETMEAHEAQFARHNVEVVLDLPDRQMKVRAVKGMIVQILENLISNSIHWMDERSQRDKRYRPRIRIVLEGGPPSITYEDNGRGIAPANRDKVFLPFFSLKESKRRRGLGLFIARDAAEHHGGTLTLSEHIDSETGRLHRFVLELPEGAQS